jgi:hypothetical protein
MRMRGRKSRMGGKRRMKSMRGGGKGRMGWGEKLREGRQEWLPISGTSRTWLLPGS